jgi:hypothetical protein
VSFDRGELLSAGCALSLLACMFAFAWYGGDSVRSSVTGARPVWTLNGWQALTVVRWPVLVTVALAIGSLLLHLSQRSHGSRTSTSAVVAILGALTCILLTYRVLIEMPDGNRVVDQKLGAVLAVLLSLGIAAGGVRSLREERLRLPERRTRRLVSGRRRS